MINEKKIKEASIAYGQHIKEEAEKDELGKLCDPVDILADSILCETAFSEGAHWAIEEFLKDLWHDAKEEPKKGVKPLLIEADFEDIGGNPSVYHYIEYSPPRDSFSENPDVAWHGRIKDFDALRWLYIDDLHTQQEGGKE